MTKLLHLNYFNKDFRRKKTRWLIDRFNHYYSARRLASAEYWIHFTARFGRVHALVYKYDESEPISMTSAEYIVEGWTWQILGSIRSLATAEEPGEFLFLSGKQRTISPISRRPNFTKFEHNTSIGIAIKTPGAEFWKFYRKGSFFPKMQTFHQILTSCDFRLTLYFATITDRRKFTATITLYEISTFHFYRWNQFKVITLACTLCTKNLPTFFATYYAGWQHDR